MKLSPLILITILFAACGSSRQSTTSDPTPPSWQQQPLIIDGSTNDWGAKPLPYFISSEKVAYDITNDNENLYIRIATKSPQEIQKIIQGGMTIWVNPKADKNESDSYGIGYPLDNHHDRAKELMEEAQPDRYKNNKPITLEDKRVYQLYGFSKDSTGNYDYGDDGNPQGIRMRMDYTNQGEMIYEAAIPLATLYPDHRSSSYASKSVAVGIFIDGLPPDANVPRGMGGGGPQIGVGGGLGFGSFGSGGGIGLSIGTGSLIGGGGNGSRKQMTRDSQTWQTVQLAHQSSPKPF